MAKRKKKKDDLPPVERDGDGVVSRNKRAAFDFELGDRFEAGLVLVGSEVKVLRYGQGDLSDAWCAVEQGEAYIHGLNIPELSNAAFGHRAKRKRKLLLHTAEIAQLQRAIERQGMTAVALMLYFRGGRAKIRIALAKGKRQVDKRQAVKEREADREAQAAIARVRIG